MAKSRQSCFRNLFEIAKNKTKKIFKVIGPGFLSGAADNDPSAIGTYSMAGAQYGLLLLWLIPFQLPLMYAMQTMCARIGLITGKGLAFNMKHYFSKPILYTALFILVCSNTINIGADISIMAASIKLVFGLNIYFWAIITTVFILFMEVFIPYHTYSKILLGLTTFLLSYIITALIATNNWLEVLKYIFTPHFEWNKEFILITTGFIGATLSPYLFFWQSSQEIEEKLDHKTKKEVHEVIKQMPKDTFIGMFFSQLVTLCIVLTSYSSLYKNGIHNINSAYDAAIALKPFAGEYASIFFSIGVIGAGLLCIPVLAGSSAYALAEIFDKPEGLAYKFHEARFFYGVIITSTLIGLLIHCIGIDPIKALLYASIINCVAAIPFVLFVLILSNKKELMGPYKNGWLFNTLGAITFLVLLASTILIFTF